MQVVSVGLLRRDIKKRECTHHCVVRSHIKGRMEKVTLAGKTTQNNKIVQFESFFFLCWCLDVLKNVKLCGLKTFFIIWRRAIRAALIWGSFNTSIHTILRMIFMSTSARSSFEQLMRRTDIANPRVLEMKVINISRDSSGHSTDNQRSCGPFPLKTFSW